MSFTEDFHKMLMKEGIETGKIAQQFEFYLLECEDGGGEDTEILFSGVPRLYETSIGPTKEERLIIIRAILLDLLQFMDLT